MTTPERLRDLAMGASITALALCIPFGLVMAFYMNSWWWLWFCVPIFIFLS